MTSDIAGLAERESATSPATVDAWVCGWAGRDSVRLVVDGRVLTGEALGEPSERWRGEIGGRPVGQWTGTGCASLALRWLATGGGAS